MAIYFYVVYDICFIIKRRLPIKSKMPPKLDHQRFQGKVISLSEWPKHPFSPQHEKLSPRTQQILKHSRVSLKQIVFQSFEEFRRGLTKTEKQFYDVNELFIEDRNRRQKKVEILQGLYHKKNRDRKCKKSESKSLHYTHRSTKLENSNKIYYLQKVSHKTSFRHGNCTHKSSTFLDYYTGTNRSHKKQIFCDESTRSRRNTNQYQIESHKLKLNKKKKQKKDREANTKTLETLNILMKKWSQVENLQLMEQQYITNHPELSLKQRNRLSKIHSIEKEQLKYQVKKLREKLQVMKKSRTG